MNSSGKEVKGAVTPGNSSSNERLRPNSRIIVGNYFADIFLDEKSSKTIFHWIVQRSDLSGAIVIGEQNTFEVARQDAEAYLMRVVAADITDVIPQLNPIGR